MGDSEDGVLRFRLFELPDLGEEFVSESVVSCLLNHHSKLMAVGPENSERLY